MIIGLSIVYVCMALALAFWGKERTIGFLYTFLISLVLTPFAGIAAVMSSQRLILYHVVQYNCPECGYSYTEHHKFCPMCLKDDRKILLEANIVPTT